MLTNTSLEKIIEQDSSRATQMNIIYECNLGHLKSITNWFFHELKINTSVNEFKLFAEECNKKNCETALQEGTNQNIEEIKLKYVNVKGSISVLEKTK